MLLLLLTVSASANAKTDETADISQNTGALQTQGWALGMTTVDVEIDIFSGMPNPVWTLTDAQATELLAKLAALQETEAKPRSSHLGYRGLIIRIQQEADQEIYIQKGFVEVGGTRASTFFSDPNRSLERWLLATGRAFVDRDVLAVIEADLKE